MTKKTQPVCATGAIERVTSQDDLVVGAFQSMSELDLTIRVLKPLFLRLGYDKVEYQGGPTEQGQDLICFGKDRFDNPEVLAAQVKKYRPSAKAADHRSFSEVVNQLCQAIETPVPMLSGHNIYPTKICFITPFPVETNALKTRFRSVRALKRRNVDVIDGPKLAELTKLKLPRLYEQLAGKPGDIMTDLQVLLNNNPLMSALRVLRTKDLRGFYTDLDLALGRRSTRRLLRGTLRPRTKTVGVEVTQREWTSLRELDVLCKKTLGVRIVRESNTVTDAKVKQLADVYQQISRQLAEASERVQSAERSLSLWEEQLCESFQLTGMSPSDFTSSLERQKFAIKEVRKQVKELDKEVKEFDPGSKAQERAIRELKVNERKLKDMNDTRKAMLTDRRRGEFWELLCDAKVVIARCRSDMSREDMQLLCQKTLQAHEKTIPRIEERVGLPPDRLLGLLKELETLALEYQTAKSELARRPAATKEPTVPVTIRARNLATTLQRFPERDLQGIWQGISR